MNVGTMAKSLYFLLLAALSCISVQATFDPPLPGSVTVNESTADVTLYTGNYTNDANCNVVSIELDKINNILLNTSGLIPIANDVWQFTITLITAMDFEVTRRFTLILTETRNCQNGVEDSRQQSILVVVLDLKDTPPQFLNSLYTASVPEDQPNGTLIVGNITAVEKESGDSFDYDVNFNAEQLQLFEYRTRSGIVNGIQSPVLDIFLRAPLDYESRRQHVFTVTARDTAALTSTCDVIIEVEDVQDTPPVFSEAVYNSRVGEAAPERTSVLSVNARDGDSLAIANDIIYSVLAGGTNMFDINNTTGVISTTGPLDIDNNPLVHNGLVTMTILAKERVPDGQNQSSVSTSTAQVLLQVEDANDNLPEFNSATYSGSIRESALPGELVSIEDGGFIQVVDMDQATSNNQFSIHLEKDGQLWDVLKPNIESQYSQASLLIQMNVENALVGLGGTHVSFQIVATDMGISATNTSRSVAEMAVWVTPSSTPAPEQQAIISLPLSTSDIIIFVVGVLLLLNIGLTVFVCYVIRGGKGRAPISFYNRNSKYYVSERDKMGRIKSAGVSTDPKDVMKPVTDETVTVTLEKDEGSPHTRQILPTADTVIDATDSSAPSHNTIASAANRNRCDVTPLTNRTSMADIPIESEAGHIINSQSEPTDIQTETKMRSPLGGSFLNAAEKPKDHRIMPSCSDTIPQNEVREQSGDTRRLLSRHYINIGDVAAIKEEEEEEDGVPENTFNVPSGKIEVDDKMRKAEETSQSSNKVKCDVIPLEQNKTVFSESLTKLLQKVQHKLAQENTFDFSQPRRDDCDLKPLQEDDGNVEFCSTNVSASTTSSFSEKSTGDVQPLIKTSPTNREESKNKEASFQNPAFNYEISGAKSKDSKLPKGQMTTLPLPASPDAKGKEDSEKSTVSSLSKLSAIQEVKGNINIDPRSTTPAMWTKPPKKQLTQTGIPPVALGLPLSSIKLGRDGSVTVTNPVYRPTSSHTTQDSLHKPAPGATASTQSISADITTEPSYTEISSAVNKTVSTGIRQEVERQLQQGKHATQQKLDLGSSARHKMLEESPKETTPISSNPAGAISNIMHNDLLSHSAPDVRGNSDAPANDYMTAAKHMLTAAALTRHLQMSKSNSTGNVVPDIEKANQPQDKLTSF